MPMLDAAALERLALNYVGRYATTRAKLAAYLRRKLVQRGWAGEQEPPIERLITRFAELGYVDDRAFAMSRAASLGRRGYGARRVAEALRAAGIEEDDAKAARDQARESAWEAAMAFARRRRIGPYSEAPSDPERRRKAFAAALRAGHAPEIVRQILDATVDEPLD